MAVYETQGDSIVLRVVYDGPGLVGKTTNLEALAEAFHGDFVPDPPDATPLARGQPAANRTRFFDWFAFDGGKLDGHNLRIQVVGVPGHKRFEARRASLLRSADAIVMVCDSTPAAQESARETFDSMREHLGALASQIPLVVQANKQDLPQALQPGELSAALGLPIEVPVVAAQASAAIGVRETVVQAVRTAVRRVKRQITRGGVASLAGRAEDAATLRGELARLPSPALPEDGPKEPPRSRRRPAQRLTLVNEPRVVQIGAAKTGKLGSRTPQREPRQPPPSRSAPFEASARADLFYDGDAPPPVASTPTTPPTERAPADPAATHPHEGELPAATLHALVELATAPHINLSPGTALTPPTNLSSGTAPTPRPSQPAARPADPPAKQARRPRTRGPAVVPQLPPTPAQPLVLPPPPRRNADKPVAAPPPASKPSTTPPAAVDRATTSTPAAPASTPAAPASTPTAAPATTPAAPATTPAPASTPVAPPGKPAASTPTLVAADLARPAAGTPALPTSTPATARPAPVSKPSAAPPASVPSDPDALPPLPRPDVPIGHVWPIPGGRDVLRAIVDAPIDRLPAPPRQSDSPPLLLAIGDWRLCSRDGQRYASREAALAALRLRARQTTLCAPLLAQHLTLVAQPEPDDHARLWHIVPRLEGIREHLALRPPQARPRLLAALANAIVAALHMWLRHGVALELDLGAFAVESGRVVHLGDRIGEPPRDVGLALLGFCERLSGDAAALAAFTAALELELTALTTEERDRLDLEAALVRAETRYQDAHVARNRLLTALRVPH